MNNTPGHSIYVPLDIETYKSAPKAPVYIILDNVRSALNVGAVFRSADAFRASGILLCGICAVPPNREILKTALGATESVYWNHFVKTSDAIQWARSRKCSVYAVEQVSGSIALNNFLFSHEEPLALVLGNEVRGVSPETIACCDGTIEIPQFGTKHSLNIAVCAGIVLWHTAAKMHLGSY